MTVAIVTRKPTVAEYESVVASVGFRSHDHEAIEVALANTFLSVCAVDAGEVVGLGRIVGDGAISFLLTNVMVRPSHQRRGIGSLIVGALCQSMEDLPYRNVVVEVVPLPGSQSFYEQQGFRASSTAPPGMIRWFHPR
jgi:predicted N-acetyltransferase YhbS